MLIFDTFPFLPGSSPSPKLFRPPEQSFLYISNEPDGLCSSLPCFSLLIECKCHSLPNAPPLPLLVLPGNCHWNCWEWGYFHLNGILLRVADFKSKVTLAILILKLTLCNIGSQGEKNQASAPQNTKQGCFFGWIKQHGFEHWSLFQSLKRVLAAISNKHKLWFM